MLSSPSLDCFLWSSSSCLRPRTVDWHIFELACAELFSLYFADWATPDAFDAPCTMVEDFSLALLSLPLIEADFAQFYLRFGSHCSGTLSSQPKHGLLPSPCLGNEDSKDGSDLLAGSRVVPAPPLDLIPIVTFYRKSSLDEEP